MLKPLVEACRPRAKVPRSDLRRTGEAILWRHENGAERRALPAEFGPWWMVAQAFIGWSRLGVWGRLPAMAQERGRSTRHGLPGRDLDPRPPEGGGRDGEKDAAPARRGANEAAGRSRSGCGTKAYVIADAVGRAVAFALAPGQAHELPHAAPLLGRQPGVPAWVLAVQQPATERGALVAVGDGSSKPATGTRIRLSPPG